MKNNPIRMDNRDEGFWIDPEGKVFEIDEHLSAVERNPALFGFSSADWAKWGQKEVRKNRIPILYEAISRGWIRVRGCGDYIEINVDELSPSTTAKVADFLKRTGALKNDPIHMLEVKPDRETTRTAGEFLPRALP